MVFFPLHTYIYINSGAKCLETLQIPLSRHMFLHGSMFRPFSYSIMTKWNDWTIQQTSQLINPVSNIQTLGLGVDILTWPSSCCWTHTGKVNSSQIEAQASHSLQLFVVLYHSSWDQDFPCERCCTGSSTSLATVLHRLQLLPPLPFLKDLIYSSRKFLQVCVLGSVPDTQPTLSFSIYQVNTVLKQERFFY